MTSAMKYLPLTVTALAVLLSSTAISPAAWAQASMPAIQEGDAIKDVRIEGNQRIEARTVLSYLNMKAGSRFTQEEIDAALKSLFATGFFSDVKLLRDDDTLVVRVNENPIISRVVFEGNDRVETSDLEKEIELQARSVYSRDKLQSDVKRILDIYRRGGRYSATVVPKIITRDQNRIELVYEITEGSVARVTKINFVGNQRYDSGSLRKIVRTEETRWYKFLTDDDKYDPDRLQYDQELLRRFYLSEGYADFQVKSAHAELSPKKDEFYLTFVVEEGPEYQFGEINVTSEIKGQEPATFSELITTKKGETYNANKVEETIDAITKDLGDHGYAFVDIQPKLEKDREKKLANITYVIKPGPRVYVERINVTGNVRTLDEVVRREFRLNEGDPYNASKLQRSEQRLNNLGYFEKVQIKNEAGSAPDKTVVNVDVQEKSTGEVNIGAGYSTTNGVLATFGVSENNLLGRGQQLKTSVSIGSRIKQGEIGFTEPYFLGRELATGFDLYRTRQDLIDRDSYISDTKGVRLRTSYSLQEKLQHGINYSLRSTDITDIQPTASTFIKQQAGKNLNSSIGHSLTYDDRDNKFNPTRGWSARFYQEVSGLGGDSRYLKDELKASYYYNIVPKWTLGFLGSGGYIFGFAGRDVRINDRFFVGGDDLRGFQNAGIGPRDTSTSDALGGNAYYVGTTELRFPLGLPEELGVSGAIFADVGSLWTLDDVGPNIFDSSTPRTSVGVGGLWQSPFGPIRIDFAQALRKETYDRTENIHFSFGTKF
ncbi:MAG: outer membrane protein assembly factor BamA [Rickettsiales bacterium]|nr:outer membrane protein assembly factor BamA [Rickettsiales bacterium]